MYVIPKYIKLTRLTLYCYQIGSGVMSMATGGEAFRKSKDRCGLSKTLFTFQECVCFYQSIRVGPLRIFGGLVWHTGQWLDHQYHSI